MTRPYCVALTGGVGSGKSLVSRLFADQGVGIIDTDLISRQLTSPDGAAMTAIVAEFGPEYRMPDGSLDRVRMRKTVFDDPGARLRLEAILHPMICQCAFDQLRAASTGYVLLVVPLLVESRAYVDMYDRVLVVDCDPGQQVERVQLRDGISSDLARAIVAAQSSRQQRLGLADDVIDNAGAPEQLEARVAVLHRSYLHAASQTREAPGQ